MTERWRRLGRVLVADRQRPWMVSHTAMPTAYALEEMHVRVYFATRDERGHPHVAFAEIDLERPQRIERLSEAPVLSPGPRGFFDDSGVYPGALLEAGDRLRMYYSGRNNGREPLFYMAIGLAESVDGGVTFERVSTVPVLSRGEHDPWMVSTPFVRHEPPLWRMWYLSGMGWDDFVERRSYYDIKYAESDDGVAWRRDGTCCVPLDADESNVGNPCVLSDGDGYRMWFSYVGGSKGYRVGHAESDDGRRWTRSPEPAFGPSEDGWDSEAVSYPFVFRHAGRLYMLYSGNGFGREGFGLAVAE